ncbi:glucoamylase family protein [Pseudopedobacter beijingensis]|uniref:Glucoamylase family protein n=1 Tax=Pseudopedobacter beijingensis TaxID=1207056 RepID=A0ABW4IEP8_9SPHI
MRYFFPLLILLTIACSKKEVPQIKDTSVSFTVDGEYNGTLSYNVLGMRPIIVFDFTEAVETENLDKDIVLKSDSGEPVKLEFNVSNEGKKIQLNLQTDLKSFSTYTLSISGSLPTKKGGKLINPLSITLNAGMSSEDKYPRISDQELLTLVQTQTFKYFWGFGHPVSGLARERNTSGNLVTSGGSGFGVMAIIVGIERGLITKEEGFARIRKIVSFLKNDAQKFHGAFSHWLDGTTGAALKFSEKDDGADLVETSLLMQGLITAKQYFKAASTEETQLRTDITDLYNNVEWDFFRKDGGDVLYWHWSPNYQWQMNLPIKGYNECLITYVLAAGSATHGIPKSVYDNGWAAGANFKNGKTYYGIQLPLGAEKGGPMFLDQYSFLGINPKGLSDAYANYEQQTRAHALINYNHCKENPNKFAGYSDECWGLTASDIKNGYTASSPTNDKSFIAPTAAIASLPYVPEESMKALRFFYYKLGDKLFKEYGFVDSFSIQEKWFANSFLAIDQGPIVIMIENYRSGLLWDLFMSSPEAKNGLTKLGFQSPAI